MYSWSEMKTFELAFWIPDIDKSVNSNNEIAKMVSSQSKTPMKRPAGSIDE